MLNLNLILIPTILFSGVDIGGKIGIVFPTGGINKTSRSATGLGAYLGYTFDRSRLALNYSYLNFPGRSVYPYELTIHELALFYNYEFFRRPVWGVTLTAGPGFGFIRRTLGTVKENGTAPDCHLGVAFLQHEGKSRVAAGLDNIIFLEISQGKRLLLTYFPGLYVEVAYAF